MNSFTNIELDVQRAADAIRTADALLIGAGAGMGVDSGLPDFRGDAGFWRAYPPFRGRRFAEMSNPRWFRADPQLAWGFFGHRMNLYRSAVPHRGFTLLRKWAEHMPRGYFVFTSNVDGQFQRAGFPEERIVECHGSIHYLQCTADCGSGIWPAGETSVEVDMDTIRARSELPRCPSCQALARPNIMMFGDWQWDPARTSQQLANYQQWLGDVRASEVVAIELGAGLAIPTVRWECEARGQVLIRINPREADAPGGIALPLGAADALARVNALLS